MTQNTPFFSIIIPTRNRSKLLKRAIDSVLCQSYTNWELIIVDDGSTDNTAIEVRKIIDNRVKYHFKTHEERSIARNYGIERATGKYVCFLDDDDEYDKGYLKSFYDYYISTGKGENILRTGFVKIFEDGRRSKHQNYIINKYKNPVHFSSVEMCGVWSLAIPSRYLENDKFPEAFPHWQDTHLIMRLFSKYPMSQLNNHNYIYHSHPEMGSIKAMESKIIFKRLELSIEAIEDLFLNYSDEISKYLPKGIKNRIIATKILHFASGSVQINKRIAGILFLKSIRKGLYYTNFKMYLYIVSQLLRFK